MFITVVHARPIHDITAEPIKSHPFQFDIQIRCQLTRALKDIHATADRLIRYAP